MSRTTKRRLRVLSKRRVIYPTAISLCFPLDNWVVNGSQFLQEETFDGDYWGFHLGEDCNTKEETPVFAIGSGLVVYSGCQITKDPHKFSKEDGGKRSWGKILIIAHRMPGGRRFFSIYGHLRDWSVVWGDIVEKGQFIGLVGRGWSEDNGWWEHPHLHLGIYTGPWDGQLLPGYWKEEMNKFVGPDYWESPTCFVKAYEGLL